MSKKAKSEVDELVAANDDTAIRFACNIVSAYVSNNQVPMAEVPNLTRSIHGAIIALCATPIDAGPVDQKPAVPIKKSIFEDHIVCLEDGRKLTMLKRYLRTHYNMSPEEYRKKWGLDVDYPMVAPAYARLRSAFAKKIGLGRVPVAGRGRRAKAA